MFSVGYKPRNLNLSIKVLSYILYSLLCIECLAYRKRLRNIYHHPHPHHHHCYSFCYHHSSMVPTMSAALLTTVSTTTTTTNTSLGEKKDCAKDCDTCPFNKWKHFNPTEFNNQILLDSLKPICHVSLSRISKRRV